MEQIATLRAETESDLKTTKEEILQQTKTFKDFMDQQKYSLESDEIGVKIMNTLEETLDKVNNFDLKVIFESIEIQK